MLSLTELVDSIIVMALARAHLSPDIRLRKIFREFSDKSFSEISVEKLKLRTFFCIVEQNLPRLRGTGRHRGNVLKNILPPMIKVVGRSGCYKFTL